MKMDFPTHTPVLYLATVSEQQQKTPPPSSPRRGTPQFCSLITASQDYHTTHIIKPSQRTTPPSFVFRE
jgi:hypothetical protein